MTGVAVDGQGRVHAVYGRGLPITELVYGVKDGGSWDLRVLDAGSYFEPALALDASGSPHIAYFRVADRTVRYRGWLGADFSNETVDTLISIDGHSRPSLAVNGSGQPHVVYWDNGGVNDVDLRYAVREEAGWTAERIDTFNGVNDYERPSLALNVQGNPRVAFHSRAQSPLLYYRRDASVWTSEVVDQWVPATCCEVPSLALDSQDNPHIAMYNFTGTALRYARYDPILGRWMKYNVYEQGGQVMNPGYPSLAIGPDDRPRIAYFDTDALRLRYFAFDGVQWVMEAPDPAGQRGQWNTLALDPVGAPHILYTAWIGVSMSVYHAWQMWPDGVPPSSSVDPVAPYWRTSAPLEATAAATDPGTGVANVTLWHRSSGDNGTWGPWTPFGTLASPPWSWAFPFPDGEGYYEFYTTAWDLAGNAETPPPAADAIAGYDATPPASAALSVVPYWHDAPPATVDASASDALSGVATVTLRYAYSPDNVTFGPWTPFGTLAAPPWSWTFPFPDGEGYYRFHTIARDIAGNAEGNKTLSDAEAAYRRADAPPVAVASASATVAPIGEPITFDGTGSTDDVGIVAYLWDFGDGATDANPVTAHAYAARGTFAVTLTVWDTAGQNDTDSVAIGVQNRPPVADAGADRTEAKYAAVQLDGTASYDPDGDPIAYAWLQLGGPPVALTGADTATPTFIPTVSGGYAFELTVDDGWGGAASDVVNVTVRNAPPVADLVAAPANVRVGRPVVLDASGSADPDGVIVDYAFDFGDGARTNATAATASHAYAVPGTYAVVLTVTDDEGDTDVAQAIVTVLSNVPPTAVGTVWPGEAGTLDTTFLFDGANSTDDVAIVAHAWDLGDGTTATGTRVEHRYAAKGPYTVTLTVTDDEGATDGVTLSVRVVNRPPVITAADPTASVALLAGATQRFAVTASDPDGDTLTYAWTLDGAAVGTDAFSYDFASGVGVYRVNVTVSDGELAAWHEWTIRVEAPPLEPNWKPLVAAVFATILVLVGAWSAKRVPEKSGSRPRVKTFVLTALPFVALEAATGAVSLLTGWLSIPPILGVGTAVNLLILVAGVAGLAYRVRKWTPPK